MRKSLVVCAGVIFILSAMLTGSSANQNSVLRHNEFVFENTQCEKTDSCGLKRVKYIVEDYKDGKEYHTQFFAQYETDSVEKLEEYALVQFMKGCAYAVDVRRGVVYSEVETHFGKLTTFKFLDWTIDSDWTDPAYCSGKGLASRFAGCLWSAVPGVFVPDTDKLYGEEKPSLPKLYMYDRPGRAFIEDGFAHNTSLQFRTCIYKTADVPAKIDDKNISFAKPIHCFEWDSSFIYNPRTRQYERRATISPVCRRLSDEVVGITGF